MRLVILGNSGSGKSTLAARLAREARLAHLDLDVLAWAPDVKPPRRRDVEASARDIAAFTDAHDAWVIEGCYTDLASRALPRCTRLLLLDPGAEACVANARLRPWEPHKFATKQEQDAALDFLVAWIRAYDTRPEDDVFSRAAHRALFERFAGDKVLLASREEIAAYRP